MSPRSPRVFVGTAETAGFVHAYAAGFTSLGLEVTSGLRVIVEHFGEHGYDIDLSDDLDRVRWPEVLARARDPKLARRTRISPRAPSLDRVAWVVARHDLFVFVYNSLRPDRPGERPLFRGIGREFQSLKRLGKKIVVSFVGPDARHPLSYDAERRALGHDFAPLATLAPTWRSDALSRPMRSLRRAERFADVILSQPNQASLALRPYHHLYAPLDLSSLRPKVPDREVPRVVHAPSHHGIKGSREILASLDRLRAAGVRFELQLLSGVPQAKVCEALEEADVVIDQLHLPLHGRLGVEAMAAGCALATSDARDLEPVPADRPVWPITPAGLDRELGALLRDRALRRSLATRALDHVRAHHDHTRVAAQIQSYVRDPEGHPPDHHPAFFAREFNLPDGVSLPTPLRAMTARVASSHALPPGVSLDDLRRRGLA